MPRVKIEYIVSFSSEDPEHPADTLLAEAVSGRRWLCARGDSSCSVVLQLARAVPVRTSAPPSADLVSHPTSARHERKRMRTNEEPFRCQIAAIEVGAHNAATVEVLGERRAAPGEAPAVLVPRAVLLSAADSRRGERPDRVRSFTGPALAPAAALRWDRLRVVCDQPYARDARLGLSFVHVYEPEAPAPAAARAASSAALPLSSDDEEFEPGELFAARRPAAALDPGARIRRASRLLETPAPARPSSPAARAPRSSPPVATPSRGPRADAPRPGREAAGGVLAGVVFALSGYEHPRRGAVRAAALALGATERAAWGPDCTHLVCAFPNTPKLRSALAAGPVRAVRAEWVEACARAGARLPWRRFATRAADRERRAASSGSDADDDIERGRGAAPADAWESAATESEGEGDGERARGGFGRLPAVLRGRRALAPCRLQRAVRALGGDFAPVSIVNYSSRK